jgi:hypothetical protein
MSRARGTPDLERTHVAMQVQDAEKKRYQRIRKEEERMKSLFNNELINDVNVQNNYVQTNNNMNRINEHNRQRRRNMMNSRSRRKGKMNHTATNVTFMSTTSSRNTRTTNNYMTREKTLSANFRFHPTLPVKQKPIRPTSPGKRYNSGSKRKDKVKQQNKSLLQSRTVDDENGCRIPKRSMCMTCQFLRLDICVHDPKQFINRDREMKRKQQDQQKQKQRRTITNSYDNNVSKSICRNDAQYLTKTSKNPMVATYNHVWKEICTQHSLMANGTNSQIKRPSTTGGSGQRTYDHLMYRPLSAIEKRRESRWMNVNSNNSIEHLKGEEVKWSWNTLEYDHLTDHSEEQWINAAINEV